MTAFQPEDLGLSSSGKIHRFRFEGKFYNYLVERGWWMAPDPSGAMEEYNGRMYPRMIRTEPHQLPWNIIEDWEHQDDEDLYRELVKSNEHEFSPRKLVNQLRNEGWVGPSEVAEYEGKMITHRGELQDRDARIKELEAKVEQQRRELAMAQENMAHAVGDAIRAVSESPQQAVREWLHPKPPASATGVWFGPAGSIVPPNPAVGRGYGISTDAWKQLSGVANVQLGLDLSGSYGGSIVAVDYGAPSSRPVQVAKWPINEITKQRRK